MTTPQPRAQPLVGVAIVFAAALLFSMNGTVSKIVLEDGLSPLRLVEIRCLGAAVVFVLLTLAVRPAALRVGRRELVFLAAYGVVGVAMVQWLYLASIERLPVSIALLIQFTAPLMVALWVRFARGEDVRRRVWAALVLCLVGLALVAQVWTGVSLDGIGMLAAALSAVALAVYYLGGERGQTHRDTLSLAAWSFGMAAVFWAIAQPWWGFPFGKLVERVDMAAVSDGLIDLSVPVWVLVTWVIVLGTVAPFGLVLVGMRRIGPTRAGLIGTAEPPLAGLVAFIVLGEVLTGWQIIGAGVVLAAIALAETSRAPRAPDAGLPEGISPS